MNDSEENIAFLPLRQAKHFEHRILQRANHHKHGRNILKNMHVKLYRVFSKIYYGEKIVGFRVGHQIVFSVNKLKNQTALLLILS